jgi:hypothetical protein
LLQLSNLVIRFKKQENFMRVLRTASIVLALSLPALAAAGDFDGAVPLSCVVDKAHDCLPTKSSCERMKPDGDGMPVFAIDFAKKEVRSPFRTALLTGLRTTTNNDSLVIQGGDLLVAWSALIDIKTGALTISVADSKGAYVGFGQCKKAEAKAK